MYGSSAIITASGKSVAGQVTSTSATAVEKPKKKKNKVFGFLKDAADFLILDDVKTVFDPKASFLDKGVAIFSVTPAGKAVKAGRLGFKLVQNSPVGKAVSKKVDQVTNKSTGKYQVGAYKDIKGVDGLDAHHAGQKAVMKKLVDNYDLNTAPAINVPKVGHTIKGPKGIVSRSTKGIDSARQLLARDIRELRRVYDDIPNSVLKEVIELNKKMYPEMRR